MRALLIMLIATLALPTLTSASTAVACTGGISQLDWFAPQAEEILLATVVEVGGPANRAPTLTPPPSPTPKPPSPFWETPPPTAFPTYDIGPAPDVQLAGIDAVFRVDAAFAGAPGTTLMLGQQTRASIERKLREWEARVSGNPSSCAIDAFVPRYELGGEYLIFREDSPDGEFTWAVFRVRNSMLDLNNDPLLMLANQNALYTTAEIYHRFFEGYAGEIVDEADYARLREPVPLGAVLAAAAYLRGDPDITPPNTGTAGLR